MKSFFSLALCAVMASVLSAQTVIQTSGQRELQSTTNSANNSQIDNRVASCLILANLGEIELAKFGQENAQDEQVKRFAKMLADDHQKLVSELKRFAPQAASTQLSDSQSANRNQQQRTTQQTASTQQNGAAQQNGTNITPGFDNPSPSQQTAAQNPTDQKLFQIEKEAVQNCVSLTKEELQEKQGQEMDKAFVGCQIGSHIHMLASLKAAENAVSPELRQVIAKAQQKTQAHLNEAKRLMKEQEQS